MMPHPHRTKRSRPGVAIATWMAPVSLVLLSIAACADSSTTDDRDTDAGSIVISRDSGDEGSSSDGAADAPPIPCAVGNLCSVPSPLKIGYVVALSGRSKDDVWASGTGGLLMHWNGQQWTALESDVHETFSSIFLTPDELWAVAGTLVLRRGFNPSSVRQLRVNEFLLSLGGVAVFPSGDAYLSYAPGNNEPSISNYLKKISNFDTGTLEVVPDAAISGTGVVPTLGARALFLVPGKALWLVGEDAAVVRYPVSPLGAGVVMPTPSRASLLGAWGHDEQLWVVGSGGTVLHFDGNDWHAQDSGTAVTLNAIFGFSSSDVWATGDNGTVLHFDGKSWSRVAVGSYSGNLRAVWGSAPDDVWIGGERAMFHWGALP